MSMSSRPTTIRDLRRATRTAVLRELWSAGPLSRTAIAERTAISLATVSNIVAALVAEGIVAQVRQQPTGLGRPATLVRLCPPYDCTIGIEVRESGDVVAELLDVAQGWKGETERLVAHASPGGDTTVLATDVVAEVLAQAGKTAATVLGVGVALPAPAGVDPEDLARRVEEMTGIRVAVCGSAEAIARSETSFAQDPSDRNLVACYLGSASALSGAIEVDGLAARRIGDGWGHTTAGPGERRCRCGARGCLEAYVGADAILARWAEAARTSPMHGAAVLTLDAFHDEALTGPGPARDVLDETARILGVALGDIINMLNPDRIVLGGPVAWSLGPQLLIGVREHARAASLSQPFARARLDLCRFGPSAVARGAATLGAERLLRGGYTKRTDSPVAMGGRAAGRSQVLRSSTCSRRRDASSKASMISSEW